MVTSCCFSVLLLAVPAAFVALQLVTLFTFDGAWRRWALLPLGVAALVACLLPSTTNMHWLPTAIAAAVAGLVALGAVWGARHRSVHAPPAPR